VTALRHLSEIWRLQERYTEILRAIEYAVEVWTRHPSLSAETAVRWALQGSEAALAADQAGAAGGLLDTAWRLCADPEAVNEALRGAVERTRAAFVELAVAAEEDPDGSDEEG
jgi:hypothetical protein